MSAMTHESYFIQSVSLKAVNRSAPLNVRFRG
jgi:hypothetical protein